MKAPFLILLLFIAINCFAQNGSLAPPDIKRITIGENRKMNELHSQLSFTVYDNDTTACVLTYKNADEKSYINYPIVSFRRREFSTDSLYNILKEFFSGTHKNDKEYTVAFKLGVQNIRVSQYRKKGKHSVMIITDAGHFYLDENSLDKLFGK